MDRDALNAFRVGALAAIALCTLACGARTDLEPLTLDANTAMDSVSDRVPVDRVLPRPDVSLRSCDGSPLPRPGSVQSARSTGRWGVTAVFDPATRRILVLGGSPSGGTRASSPFALEVDTGRSVPLRLDGVGMLPIGAVAVWDERRSRAVVVAGRYPDGGFFEPSATVLDVRIQGDTARVSRLADYPAGAVDGVAIAIDPERDALVATGGSNGSVPATTAFGATWSLSLAAASPSWERRASEAQSPPAGTRRQMGWDPTRRQLVLAGGWMGVTRDRRAWALEGDRWREVAGTLDAIPDDTTGLVWDPRACGFVMTVGRCSAELWLLRVGVRAEMALLGRLQRSMGFAGADGPALFRDDRNDGLLLLGGENCQMSGFVAEVFERVPIVR